MRLLHNSQKSISSFFPWGFTILDRWLQIKNRGGSLAAFFLDNQIDSVAIYGMGEIGKRLYEELKGSRVKVAYGIDKNAKNIFIEGLAVYRLDETLPKVNAVIVTPMHFYEIQKEIYRRMGKEVDVVFVEDVVAYCINRE